MIALTSISPNHKNDQAIAVKTWLDLGIGVVSFNNKEECKLLSSKYQDVLFIETKNTLEKIYKRPHVAINVLFDYIKKHKEDEPFVIINSDIELSLTKEQLKAIEDKLKDGFICANRINYNNNKINGSRYEAGLDVFFLTQEHILVYCSTSFALGQCHFDYWLPFRQINHNKKVYLIDNPIAYHQEHAVQYNADMWKLTGAHFAELENMQGRDIGRMSTDVFKYIYKHMERITI